MTVFPKLEHQPCYHHKKEYQSLCSLRFRGIEIRIGNEDESGDGTVQLQRNPLVGYYEGGNSEATASIQLDTISSGRYLTVQNVVQEYLEIAEVYIFF